MNLFFNETSAKSIALTLKDIKLIIDKCEFSANELY